METTTTTTTTTTWVSRLWHGSEAVYTPLHNKAKGALSMVQSSTRGVVVLFLLLLAFVAFISTRWIDGNTLNSWSQQALSALSRPPSPPPPPPKPQPIPISLNCPIPSDQKPTAPTCRRPPSPAPAPSSASHSNLPHRAESSGPSCPAYFRWIHEDLRPWNAGITRELLESGRKHATFRLVVLDGRVYIDKYRGTFQTRDVFTIWGILQLVARYPGRVPDLDLMFDCDDFPAVRTVFYRDSTPPPVFHYCKDDGTVDILFPDWSFWGWTETNIKPWNTLMEDLKEANERVNWSDRIPYAFWRGNPMMGGHRQDLMKCNASNGQDWGARLYVQDWIAEMIKGNGYKNSNLANQCAHRYKIFVEGIAWSVSQKYIMACNSPTLYITPHFYEFFTRGLMPMQHYWPIDEKHKCRSIKSAVDWGNQHPQEAEAMGRAGSGFMQEDLKMDYVYDYMLHLLTEYAKLLKYKPTLPVNATEICMESVACNAMGGVKKYMMESMVKETHVEEPCTLPPAFTAQEFQDLAARKSNATKQVEMWEERIWDKKDNQTRA